MFAVVGLIGGILAGLFNPGGPPHTAGQGVSDRRSGQSTTRVNQPRDRFYTVVLASIALSRDRSEAEARADKFRAEGVQDVGVLDPRRYRSLNDNWAVYSGVFERKRDALDHRDDLRNRFPDLASAYLKYVTSES